LKNVFIRNCCLMMDVWRNITHHETHGYGADLRGHPAYSHHFAFFYGLPRPDDLDDEMLDSAMESAHAFALDERQSWDGGKSIWDSWYHLREFSISEASDIDIFEWKAKYILMKPELFNADTDDFEKIKQALRSHADSYMLQVIIHLTTV
jgi:hypothetical protein